MSYCLLLPCITRLLGELFVPHAICSWPRHPACRAVGSTTSHVNVRMTILGRSQPVFCICGIARPFVSIAHTRRRASPDPRGQCRGGPIRAKHARKRAPVDQSGSDNRAGGIQVRDLFGRNQGHHPRCKQIWVARPTVIKEPFINILSTAFAT